MTVDRYQAFLRAAGQDLPGAVHEAKSGTQGSPMHIYLVEVDNYTRQIIAQHLQGLGHRVRLLPTPFDGCR